MTDEELLQYVKSRFSYDPYTGLLYNRRRNRPSGCSQLGYLTIKINKQNYFIHRLAWLITYGKLPQNEIDHIDGNRGNNRISNLREVSHRENCQNLRCHREGLLPGAQWDPVRKRYRARLRIKGKRIRLGNYITAQEAHEVYMRACAEYGVTA